MVPSAFLNKPLVYLSFSISLGLLALLTRVCAIAARVVVNSMDASILNSLPVNDIGMIKVIKGPFVGAIGNGGGGTIAIYTIRADEDDFGMNSD